MQINDRWWNVPLPITWLVCVLNMQPKLCLTYPCRYSPPTLLLLAFSTVLKQKSEEDQEDDDHDIATDEDRPGEAPLV